MSGDVIELRGLCWDHPRCTAPMATAAREWTGRHPEVVVRWDARPLAAFNDQPIEVAVRGYDLVFIDHPHVAETAPTGCLAPLDDLIAPDRLAALAADSIAASHHTYSYAGRQWALAIDAACQMAVADDERLAALGVAAPRTWAQVIELARRHRGAVALPLYPSDAFCALLSLSAARGGALTEPLITEEAVAVLRELAGLVGPRWLDANPPALLDCMAGDADMAPAYAPLVFGYTDYQRPGASGRRLRFLDVPAFGGEPEGAVLGGAGLAVTAGSGHPREAAAFAAWVAGTGAQRDIICRYGGQPASATVWADPAADTLVGGFFGGTRATIERACVRPLEPWWPRFQAEAGDTLVTLLRDREPEGRIHAELGRILDRHRSKEYAR